MGVGEELLAQAGQHLRDYLTSVGNPNNTVVFVYRQIQVSGGRIPSRILNPTVFSAKPGAPNAPMLV